MLKTRIIPTLLWKDTGLVKGIGFDSWRRVGTILPAIKVYNLREVDELMVMDINATLDNRSPDLASVEEFAYESFLPLTIGGGVRSIEDIKGLLRCGADKVSINTAAYADPTIIDHASNFWGTQCIVASIDARLESDGRHQCYSHSGTVPTGMEVTQWAQMAQQHGAGELLITSIERDGTMEGYDIQLIRKVSDAVNIPVIASGGAGNYEHFFQAISLGKAQAVAAASLYHFTEQTPHEAKMYLKSKGIKTRK